MMASSTISSDTQISNLIHDVLKVSYLEEAFNFTIIHHHNEEEADKFQKFYQDFVSIFTPLTPEFKESAIRKFLLLAASQTNSGKLNSLLQVLLKLINANVLTPRHVCEQILLCDKLVFQNKEFWIGSFQLIRKIIGGVDYKGVREIMKGCRDKTQTFPHNIDLSILPQMEAVQSVLEHIFDRNASLLPAYFIANEIQKSTPLHPLKINKLAVNFVEDFRNIAQMVSVIGHSKMLPIVEHFGYTETLNPWRLDPNTLKFTFRGILPYDAELFQPQTHLLRYVLEQPYSKDMVCSMLNLQKQSKTRCVSIEEQLVWLIMSAMERSEADPVQTTDADEAQSPTHWLWVHISSQLIYFVLFQFASFPNIVVSLHDKLAVRDLRKGRDYLMWALLQFISGSIQRNPLSNFLSVISLYDILYPEREPLPVPDCTKTSYCTRQMAPTCIWFHLQKKAQSEHININRPIPLSLKKHHEFLQHLMMSNNAPLTMGTDFVIVLMCNAYSTHPEYFTRPMAALVESINKNVQSSTANTNVPTFPLPMITLDSLTVHAKMSLIHSIVSHIIKQAQTQTKGSMPNVINMDPALVETYSRLLVYTEIESLGIKGFLSQLLPAVFKSQAWGILHTLLEMLSYRMHHIQPFYRVQLLSHLHSLASVPHTNLTQLHLCVESTALRLITGLGSAEVPLQLTRYFTEPKLPGSAVSLESEEFNRTLILTIARSMHITGSGNDDQSTAWCKDLLITIMQNTPHSWASHTLACFPTILNTFFSQNSTPKENKQQLKKSVEEEYRNWVSMSNENDVIAHFSVAGTPPLFLCLLFKMILETDGISAVAYKILERLGARALSAHLRKLCDYLVFEVTDSGVNMHINKCVDTINDMIWKYNVVTIDRLVLCLALRTHEGNEAQVCFFIIQLLLLKTHEFRNRVQEFVKENSPDYWKQTNWHEKHLAFHQKYREKFTPDESVSHPTALPVYFGNVCLRFIPVLDIVIHRFLEVSVSSVTKTLEIILEHLGVLYKFHDRPIQYLYNTLHFYERKLRNRPPSKKRLVAAVCNALSDMRPPNWALTEQYQSYIEMTDAEATLWNPELSYYISIMRRFIDTISGKNIFYLTDWRFNEFPNAAAHALYVTCVELMSLPVGPQGVANNIIDVVLKGYTVIPQDEIHSWINAIGVIMSSLPEAYWSVMYDRLHELITCSKMVDWSYRHSPFEMFNFKVVKESMLEKSYVLLLAICQSVLHHSSIGQISTIADYIKDKLKHFVQNEYQLIYLCHLFAPFMLRLDQERPRIGYELTTLLYELLEQVDKKQSATTLKYMDPICDLLYHIKYMFVGDMLKVESETIIRKLRPALQMRLRFITHLNVDEIASENSASNDQANLNVGNVQSAAAVQQQQQQQQQSLQQQQQQQQAVPPPNTLDTQKSLQQQPPVHQQTAPPQTIPNQLPPISQPTPPLQHIQPTNQLLHQTQQVPMQQQQMQQMMQQQYQQQQMQHQMQSMNPNRLN